MEQMNLSTEHNDLCVGIDLGTTNSVLATINVKPNGDIVSKVVEIPRAVDIYNTISGEAKLTTQKKPTLPSCVYYREEKNYEPLIGDFAKIQYPLRPHLVAKSMKSQMGNAVANGLLSDIPDKTPAQVSSRILEHMLKQAKKIYKCDISDAVITVPANFDSAMCKATRDAAELAGIKVRNEDGSERPVLLSEPNAVIYDLINQIHNGEIPNRILDLSEKKNVLVFDLGGGTLDITMHEIKKRDGLEDSLKVNEIATNRYTLLGGDDFDELIAKKMFERYIKQYRNHPEIVNKIKHEEKTIMPQLRNYAEQLKLDLSERCGDTYSSGWDDEDDIMDFPVGGNMGGIGYAYDDTFTKEEIEGILNEFMAYELSFEDFKKIDKILSTRNIIYPILDVLNKASKKLNTQEVTVDAVIVNGGMSKFYMVTDRLKRFFGFEPIVALDPDQAVARGAAVYHYLLHKHEFMQDDMRMLGNVDSAMTDKKEKREVLSASHMAIEWGKTILNDSLYLGVKNGAVHMIIPTGAELPYQSQVMTGFKVEPGQSMIEVPIKSRNIDGTYRTIANGNIIFKKKYNKEAFVAFIIYMGSNKVITMKAWTSRDIDGKEKLEEGYVEIAINNSERSSMKNKIIAPSGSKLRPREEINNLIQLCKNVEKCRNKIEKSTIFKRITSSVNSICYAGNQAEFGEAVLEALGNTSSQETKQRLFFIARKIGNTWSPLEKERLAKACMDQIRAELIGMSIGGPRISTNIQAIYTLSICAEKGQLDKLEAIHDKSKYLQCCLYTHAKTKTHLAWILKEFQKDMENVSRKISSNIQFSSYAVGMALRRDGVNVLDVKNEEKIVEILCHGIQTGNLTDQELICCILALGWICDQRAEMGRIDSKVIAEVLHVIYGIEDYYTGWIVMRCNKIREIAAKMIQGDVLDVEEEQFLLTKLEF